VTVLANANTGLAQDDVFYFGNVVGYVNGSNTNGRYTVNAIDTSAVRTNQSSPANSVLVSNLYDLNKSGNVNALDTAIVRTNQQSSGIVNVIGNAPMFLAFEGNSLGVASSIIIFTHSGQQLADEPSRLGIPAQPSPSNAPGGSNHVPAARMLTRLVSLKPLTSTESQPTPQDLPPFAAFDAFFANLGRNP
jgi:hypothetical protein